MAEYDSLVIKVSADTKSANSGLTTLRKNLTLLEQTTKQLDVQSIQQTQKLLQNISKIDFTNVSQGLKDVVTAFKALQSMSKTKGAQEQIKNGVLNSTAYSNSSNFSIGENSQLGTISDTAIKAKKNVDGLTRSIKKLDSATKKASGSFEKIAKAFKRIAFYRVVRRAIQLIAQEMTKAIESLAQFDSEFNKSISEIKSSFSYLGRSILALIAPIIKLVSPFIAFITSALGDLTNDLGAIIASLTGDNIFSGAKENAEDFAESLKKAKNTALGIDELNVIGQDNEDDNWFSMDIQATSGLADVIEKLKKEWQPIISGIKAVLVALQPIVSIIGELLHDLVYDTSGEINGSIHSLIGAIENLVNLISTLLITFKPILKLLNSINSLILNLMNSSLTALFDALATIIEVINIILTPILEPLADILKVIGTLLEMIFSGIGLVLIGLLKEITPCLMALWELLKALVTGNWDLKIWQGIKEAMLSAIRELVMNFANAVDNFVRSILAIGDRIGAIFGQDWGLVANYGGGWVSRLEESGFATPSSSGENATTLTNLLNVANSNGSNSNGSTEVNVYVDSEQVAKKVEERIDRKGFTTIQGGYKYGY